MEIEKPNKKSIENDIFEIANSELMALSENNNEMAGKRLGSNNNNSHDKNIELESTQSN